MKKRAILSIATLSLVLMACGSTAPSVSSETDSNSPLTTSSTADAVSEDASAASPEDAASEGAENNPSNASAQITYPLTLQDSMGNPLQFDAPPKRVVAMTSSFTEIWLLAGGRDTLAGAPKDAAEDRHFDVGKAEMIGSMQKPSSETILAMNPDFVILSADLAKQVEVGKLLEKSGVTVYQAKVETFDDYLKVLKDFTDLTGNTNLYEEKGTSIRASIEDLLAKYPKDDPQPSYLFLRGSSTDFKVQAEDTVTTDILDEIGAKNIAGGATVFKDLSLESILAADPDFLFFVYQGDKDKFEANFDATYRNNPIWKELRAVKENHFYILDKNLFHYKPNANWDKAYETLFKILRPDLFGSL